eukprot:TRINITY_DN4049_c0_g1_i3.p1 TRINITY_DN4049_c0_g1~~TRINITY_DN4049_c0_g1_i3.p1  ORF type:complete len:159 (-),score=39.47 TRINITY_DN4049_c0_g1_i3:73-549(-)
MSLVGVRFPAAVLHEGTPKTEVKTDELLKGKKVVLFAVPGAFTPGCSKSHLPGYVADHEKLKSKGVDEIICLSVNDAFVMDAWGQAHQAQGKVRMLADPRAELTKALGMELDATASLGNVRSKRYSMVITDGVISAFYPEPDGRGLTCSLSNHLLSTL